MNLGSRTSWARSKCSTITRDGRPLNTSYESHQVLGSAIHHQSYYTCVLKLQSYDVLNSLDWVRNQRQRHTNPTIYSTLDCFIKQKESILEYNPLLILPYIWWLWPRTIPKIMVFQPMELSSRWETPETARALRPPFGNVQRFATQHHRPWLYPGPGKRLSWEWEQNLWPMTKKMVVFTIWYTNIAT